MCSRSPIYSEVALFPLHPLPHHLRLQVVGTELGADALAAMSLGNLTGNLTGLSVVFGVLSAMDTLAPQAAGAGVCMDMLVSPVLPRLNLPCGPCVLALAYLFPRARFPCIRLATSPLVN